MQSRLPAIELIPLPLLIVALLTQVALTFALIFVVFPTGALNAFGTGTAGLITGTLVANVAMMTIIFGVLLTVLGKPDAAYLGLRLGDLASALGLTALIWVLLNLSVAVWQQFTMGHLIMDERWQDGVGVMLGALLTQLLGNALFEEAMFRGVLMRQFLYRLIEHGRSYWMAAITAALASSAVFALLHLILYLTQAPNVVSALSLLPAVFVAGCVFALLYLYTGNLLVVVGVHALANTPTLLLKDPFGYDNLPFLIALASTAAFLWNRFYARR